MQGKLMPGRMVFEHCHHDQHFVHFVIVISTRVFAHTMLMIAGGVVGSPSMKIGPRILCVMRKLRLVCEIYRSGIIPTKLMFTRQRR